MNSTLKVLLIIVIPTILLVVFGSSFTYTNIAYKSADWVGYIGEEVAPISLTGGYSFTDGANDAAIATIHLVALPFKLIYKIFEIISVSLTYWGVTL